MNLLNKLYNTLTVTLISISGYGQIEFVSVPSANASSTAKNGDVPVNYNNGTSQVTIPIYTIQDNDINLPVILNYQTGGIKVTDVSNSIGSGWQLQSGGTITRIVRDLPDDLTSVAPYGPAGYIGYHQNPSAYNSDAKIDHTPDLYFFNILGYTGSFTLNTNGDVVFKYATDVKIERYTSTPGVLPFYHIKYFKVILPNGYMGYFGYYNNIEAIDYSVSYDQEAVEQYEEDPDICWNFFEYFNCIKATWVRTSWNIVQIVSPTQHQINFDYDLERYLEYALPEESVGIKSPCNFNFDYNPTDNLVYHEIYQNRLKLISSDYYRLDFVYDGLRLDLDTETKYSSFITETVIPKQLSKIEIKSKKDNTWTGNKIYSFVQSYSEANVEGYNYETDWIENLEDDEYPDIKRLFLDKIIEKSWDGTISYETVITYFDRDKLTRRLSHAQDYWGYNNGQETNLSLVARPIFDGKCLPALDCRQSTWSKFADREPNLTFTRAGSLKSIHYPAGSHTEYTFEQNEIRAKEFVNTSITPYQGESCNISGSDCNSCNSSGYGSTFQILGIDYDENSLGKITINYKFKSCYISEGTISIYTRETNGTYGPPIDVYQSKIDLSSSHIITMFNA